MAFVCQGSGKINLKSNSIKISNKLFCINQCLFFIQAEMFKETVLKVEGDNVSASECSFYLENLKGNIMLRKDEKYVDVATEKEMTAIIKSNKSEQQSIENAFFAFYGKLVFI